jgi:hypothetical protein
VRRLGWGHCKGQRGRKVIVAEGNAGWRWSNAARIDESARCFGLPSALAGRA